MRDKNNRLAHLGLPGKSTVLIAVLLGSVSGLVATREFDLMTKRADWHETVAVSHETIRKTAEKIQIPNADLTADEFAQLKNVILGTAKSLEAKGGKYAKEGYGPRSIPAIAFMIILGFSALASIVALHRYTADAESRRKLIAESRQRAEALKKILEHQGDPGLKAAVHTFSKLLDEAEHGKLEIERTAEDLANKLLIHFEKDDGSAEELEKITNELMNVKKDLSGQIESKQEEISQLLDQFNQSEEDRRNAVHFLSEIIDICRKNNIKEMYEEQLTRSQIEHQKLIDRFRDVAEHCALALERGKGAQEIIDELSKTGTSIYDVINAITMVADRTDNLSLNATIEAARAGDAGRGFQVVATEVKSLASQTTDQMKNIEDKITAIDTITDKSRNAILGVVEANEEMKKIIDHGEKAYAQVQHEADDPEPIGATDVLEEVLSKANEAQKLLDASASR